MYDDNLDYRDTAESAADYSASRHIKQVFVPAALSFLMVVIGLYFFVRDWSFFEVGQFVIIGLYLLFVGLFYWSLSKFRLFAAFLMLALCVGLIFASQQKFQWRKDYVYGIQTGNPFPLEAYIEKYPPYEEYLLAPYLKTPDWVRFNRDCVEPVLNDLAAPPVCSSMPRILTEYNIDVQKELRSYRSRMASTAKRIERGQIRQKKQYEDCIAKKQCAEVPLLPKHIDPETLDPGSKAHLEIRQTFWQLLESRELTPSICGYILLCRVMNRTGAVDYGTVAPARKR